MPINASLLGPLAQLRAKQRDPVTLGQDLAAGLERGKMRMEMDKTQQDNDIASGYRTALQSLNPEDPNDLASLREKGYGPESIPLGTELATRGEKKREYDLGDATKKAILDQTTAYQTGQVTNMEAQRKADADKLAEEKRHNTMMEYLGGRGLDIKAKGKPVDPSKAAKIRDSKAAAIQELTGTQEVLKRLMGDQANGIPEHPGLMGLTGMSGAIPIDMPGGKTKDAEALRQQLIAKSAFGELQKMRANSPTGGALGQVSDKEEAMLSNAAAALQRGQSADQFRKNLKIYNDLLEDAKQNISDAYTQDYGEDAAPLVPTAGITKPAEIPVSNPSDRYGHLFNAGELDADGLDAIANKFKAKK